MKPLSSEVEVDLSVNKQSENYDQEAPLGLTKQVSYYLNVLICSVTDKTRVEFVFTCCFLIWSVSVKSNVFMFNVWALAWLSFSWRPLDLFLFVWWLLYMHTVVFFFTKNLLFLLPWLCFYCLICPPYLCGCFDWLWTFC